MRRLRQHLGRDADLLTGLAPRGNPKGPPRRTAWAATFAAALSIATPAVAACAAGSGSGGPVDGRPGVVLVGEAAADREYRAAVAQLVLPPGATLPPGLGPAPEPTVYQEGYGQAIAQAGWICAWVARWLDTRAEGGAVADEAMRMLRRAPQTEYLRLRLDEPGRRFYAEQLAKAELGDPSGMLRYARANCDRS